MPISTQPAGAGAKITLYLADSKAHTLSFTPAGLCNIGEGTEEDAPFPRWRLDMEKDFRKLPLSELFTLFSRRPQGVRLEVIIC